MESEVGPSVDWDGHIVLVHDNEEQRRAGVAAWARRGLEAGSKVLYIESPDESADRRFLGVLAENDIDVEPLIACGQLEVIPVHDETYAPGWQEALVDEALGAGYRTVRWSGEAETAWTMMSPLVHADLEWTTDALCRRRPVSILCQYSSSLPQATLESVCAMHANGVRQPTLQTTPLPSGIALAGEVDRSNERILRLALTAAAATRATNGTPLRVDLSEVGFLDAAGARALLTGTTAHRLRGGSVQLCAAQRPVARLLRLLHVDRTDGFQLEGVSP